MLMVCSCPVGQKELTEILSSLKTLTDHSPRVVFTVTYWQLEFAQRVNSYI